MLKREDAMRKVLVCYASRYGSTKEIAKAIAEVLTARGHDVETRSAKEAPAFEGYDAVVAGSSVRAGQVNGSLVKLFSAQRQALQDKTVALFAVGAELQANTDEARTKTLATLAPLEAIVKPLRVGAFAGAILPDRLPWIVRLTIRLMRAEEGDFRDWEKIRAWAAEIAEAIETSPAISVPV